MTNTTAGVTNREQLIEVMAKAFAIDEGADSDPWVNYQDPKTGLMVPYWHSYLTQVSAALTALEAAGVCLVPKEATEDMIAAGRDANDKYATEIAPCSAFRALDAWRTMTAASPYRP